ncbi:iron complex transport system ATP-binding protein [Kytococcus aerolatus]|uniref:Iron complex transport system ATP-binding protein n=1 Tax=Kytococcus aerolatus TaxID=592308 RepID=A0A212U6F8_9MICO|nr:ATP-binding cassette domain-containing protein [Kytococcus aerolatus]SNC73817.1 iron complex transport system ATP-binding protein [Kytococcus aerolatus]
MIITSGVHKAYSDEVTIGPVDLEIPGPGITALVGPNGAGKSTLLTIMGRLLGADAGTTTVGGYDVTRTPGKTLAKVVSVLRQENHFVTRLTVRQLVGLGRFPHCGGRLTAEDHRVVDDALHFFGLEPLQGRFLDELSGGQRQRAYVAMVLAQETPHVLLDEPLNNLDMRHAVSMMQHLRRAADELERTIVLVVHDINFAARYADTIVVMKDGRVVETGPPAQILRDELLSGVFETPVRCIEGPDGPLAVYF